MAITRFRFLGYDAIHSTRASYGVAMSLKGRIDRYSSTSGSSMRIDHDALTDEACERIRLASPQGVKPGWSFLQEEGFRRRSLGDTRPVLAPLARQARYFGLHGRTPVPSSNSSRDERSWCRCFYCSLTGWRNYEWGSPCTRLGRWVSPSDVVAWLPGK